MLNANLNLATALAEYIAAIENEAKKDGASLTTEQQKELKPLKEFLTHMQNLAIKQFSTQAALAAFGALAELQAEQAKEETLERKLKIERLSDLLQEFKSLRKDLDNDSTEAAVATVDKSAISSPAPQPLIIERKSPAPKKEEQKNADQPAPTTPSKKARSTNI